MLSGVSSFGRHIGVGSSYGAFLAPLGHIAARLHAIGNQARHDATGENGRPMILICGHAGLTTGEDGPTHADPQPLQLLQENFPFGSVITLTPWDAQEIWPLLAAALRHRPSVIAPLVTRTAERVLYRDRLGMAPATAVSRSALGSTMSGAFPPSSIEASTTLSAQARSSSRPTSVEPVNDSFRTSGRSSMSFTNGPVGTGVTRLTTPRGTPARRSTSTT
jgi:hypothetical protein